PDWSAAYTPNCGPMDAVIKVQLQQHRSQSAQEYVRRLRAEFLKLYSPEYLEFSFDSGGLIRGALNEGKSSPLNIQLLGKNPDDVLFKVADEIHQKVSKIPGIVDARVLQKNDAPEYMIVVDRAEAANAGLTQDDIMKN